MQFFLQIFELGFSQVLNDRLEDKAIQSDFALKIASYNMIKKLISEFLVRQQQYHL